MDSQQALHQFFSGFGVPAYDRYSIPDSAIETFPRLTYEVAIGDTFDRVAITADVWDRNSSWKNVVNIFNSISDTLGRGGVTLPFDGGGLWITKAQPWGRRLDDGDDSSIRRIHLNMYVEFINQ